jgi:hypothetical protein
VWADVAPTWQTCRLTHLLFPPAGCDDARSKKDSDVTNQNLQQDTSSSGTSVGRRPQGSRVSRRATLALAATPGTAPVCSAVNRHGKACSATPTLASGGRFCWTHDPAVPGDEKVAAAVRGGYAATRQTVLPVDVLPATLRSPEDATALLETTVQQVRTGQIAPAVANSIGYLVSIALRSFELDIVRRLDELERARAAHATPIRIVTEGQR